jgi:endonuclease/exonuclease/phosphatase family metal-dependent hydrolase
MIFRFCAVFTAVVLTIPNPLAAQSNDLADLEFGTPTNFDVATWNIEFFPKEGQETIDYVIEIIEEMELDVIAIQEIDDENQFEELLDLLQGYEGFYQENSFLGLGFIYNAQSVTLEESYELYTGSDFGNPFPRRPLVMELTFMGEHSFTVINNHFKCCGDSFLDENDFWDEETRRAYASELLLDYMDSFLPTENVIMLGDLNDLLTDPAPHNVFQTLIDSENYLFADMGIAQGGVGQWSFPSWPSHLDHILISDELYSVLLSAETQIETIQIDDFFPGGFNGYEDFVSDHLPVAIGFNPESIVPLSSIEALDNGFKVRIYPNPTSGIVNITTKGKERPSELYVSDYLGRKVRRFKGGLIDETVTLDLTDLPNGIYYLNLLDSKGRLKTEKVVVSH